MSKVKYKEVGDGYECTESYVYYSIRYNKTVTVKVGFYSDGATKALDVDTSAWWVHDVVCRYGVFDDGTPCTNWQASSLLSDILREEGYWFRATTWRYTTFLFGGGAARRNK